MGTYHILSLDGGGIRGLLTAVLIERLEAARPGFLNKFDLFAGTSTGAILALGLAHGFKPVELRLIYETRGHEIFADSLLRTIREIGFVRGAKYSNRNLKRVLEEKFGDGKLGELAKKVLIATFDLDNRSVDLSVPRMWKAKFFHNFPGEDSDGLEHIVDVALRSSAAPTYFPVYQGYVDGFVIANNPSMCALAQALHVKSAKLDEIVLLSIGTGLNLHYLPAMNADWGLRQWAVQVQPLQRQYMLPLITVMWEGGVGLVNYQCHQLLEEHFHRLDPILPEWVDIDDVSRVPRLIEVGYQMPLKDTLAWLDQYVEPAPNAVDSSTD